jgi:hypothetical protein
MLKIDVNCINEVGGNLQNYQNKTNPFFNYGKSSPTSHERTVIFYFFGVCRLDIVKYKVDIVA